MRGESLCLHIQNQKFTIDESRAGVETRVFIGSKSGLTNTLARKLGPTWQEMEKDP